VRNSIPPMKVWFAALLLFFQLQPVLGTAACLGLSKQGPQQECQMPEHGAAPHSTVAQTGSSTTSNCALASVCAPTPLAIISLPENIGSVTALHSEAPRIVSATLSGISSAPPFHPPRS
jgi:hypothetical protein